MADFRYHFFWFLLGLFALQLLLSLVLIIRMRRKSAVQGSHISSVSVVIPFHNEAERIVLFLRSLNRQSVLPENIELIFADDASTDGTINIIREQLQLPFSHVELARKSGKKRALHAGIEKARYEFILTLDADVSLPENYFEALLKLPASDMIILPVKMGGKKILQRLAVIEFDWLQLLTFGSPRPTLCNGANLLFRKEAYWTAHSSRADFDLASGDDVFLLAAFIKNKQQITRLHLNELTVKTPAPVTAAELFAQRHRWISKLSRMADARSFMALLFLAIIETAFIFSLVFAFFNPLYWIAIALKFTTEFLIALNAARSELGRAFFTTLAHQLWYPFYVIALFLPRKKEARWLS